MTITKGLRSEQASHFMQSTHRPQKKLSAEEISRIAERGNDVSYFFTNTGKIMVPIQDVKPYRS
jgi:hypothetical protein